VRLAGDHIGCFELFATDQVRTIRDLMGKTVAATELGGASTIPRIACAFTPCASRRRG
jgi:hypothetical protein